MQKDIQEKKVLPSPFLVSPPSAYPLLQGVLSANTSELLDVSAASAVVMDNTSKVVFFSKNPTFRFSMASTTKIMTAVVGLSHYKDSDILTVAREHVDGTIVGFKKGEQVFFQDALYAMMLPSGNDAAMAIADNYPGGQDAFVTQMNKVAKQLHLNQTKFVDPAGLADDGDYTTAVDLAHLASFAIQDKTFSKIVSTKQKNITTVDGSHTFVLSNLNKLLGSGGVNGIKTGFTDEAKGVLVTSKTEGDHTFIIVIMRSDDRFLDTQKLLSVISENTTYVTIHR